MQVIEFAWPKELGETGPPFISKKGLEDSYNTLICKIPKDRIIKSDNRVFRVYVTNTDGLEIRLPWMTRAL